MRIPVREMKSERILHPAAAAVANSLQSCPTPCDPIDGSPSGSFIHGIFQARVLEWGAIAFSDLTSQLLLILCTLSCVQHFVTRWTAARQAPLSMGFFRQEYWSGVPSPSPGGLPRPGIETRSPALQADALLSEPPGKSCASISALQIDSSVPSFQIRTLGRTHIVSTPTTGLQVDRLFLSQPMPQLGITHFGVITFCHHLTKCPRCSWHRTKTQGALHE